MVLYNMSMLVLGPVYIGDCDVATFSRQKLL